VFLSSKILAGFGLVGILATATTAVASDYNPWALHPQQGQSQAQPQGNLQGGFNMGGGLTLGGGQPQPSVVTPQFAVPQAAPPAQVTAPKVAQQPQPALPPVVKQPQFGIYPPLSGGNTQTTMIDPAPRAQPAPRPVQPYGYGQTYNYGQRPYGFNPGYGGFNPGFGGFGFPGFGGFPGFNGFNNFGFGFGFGGGFVAPGPNYRGYSRPYSPNNQQPAYRVQPGRTGN